MGNVDSVTYRPFEPSDLQAVRLLSYSSDDVIDDEPDLMVAVEKGEIIAAAGLISVAGGVVELSPFLYQADTEETVIQHLLDLMESKAKAEAWAVLFVECLRSHKFLLNLYLARGYSADRKVLEGRTKFVRLQKDLNYFRQHDLTL